VKAAVAVEPRVKARSWDRPADGVLAVVGEKGWMSAPFLVVKVSVVAAPRVSVARAMVLEVPAAVLIST
jgi:hypothetical protein